MKSIIFKILVLTIIAGTLFFSCASSSRVGSHIEGKETVIEAWNEEGTEFTVMGEGRWSEENNNAPQIVRRKEARAQAKLEAQAAVVEKFVSIAIQSANITKINKPGAKGYIESKLEGSIRGGSIVKEIWNDEEGITIYYKVTGKNLRNSIEAIFQNLTDEQKKEFEIFE